LSFMLDSSAVKLPRRHGVSMGLILIGLFLSHKSLGKRDLLKLVLFRTPFMCVTCRDLGLVCAVSEAFQTADARGLTAKHPAACCHVCC
jgi:hypothetical protein